MASMRRLVALYAGLLGATILLGLATRAWPSAFPTLVARYGGDTLWAAMLVWLLALLRPTSAARTRGLLALGIAGLVEVSQLAQGPWIAAVRETRLGALVLGQGFLWSDLLCYALGVTLAVTLDARLLRPARPAT
jgi:hypothetical protein